MWYQSGVCRSSGSGSGVEGPREHYGDHWSAYGCPVCGYFHIGHTPAQNAYAAYRRKKQRHYRLVAKLGPVASGVDRRPRKEEPRPRFAVIGGSYDDGE